MMTKPDPGWGSCPVDGRDWGGSEACSTQIIEELERRMDQDVRDAGIVDDTITPVGSRHNSESSNLFDELELEATTEQEASSSSLEEDKFDIRSECFLFFAKLLIEQGVFPNTSSCCFCDANLSHYDGLHLLPEQGGFSCSDCSDADGQVLTMKAGKEIWKLLKAYSRRKYQQVLYRPLAHAEALPFLFQFFCYQFQLSESSFKSKGSIF